jgi:hypothetical protein
LQSNRTNIFLVKIWGPLLCVGAAFVVFGANIHSRTLLLAFPFLIAALFGALIAMREVRGGVLHYRRLFKWKPIQDNEIVSGRVEFPPFIGSIRLNRLTFPWGRLYFVLDKNLDPNPFHKGEYAFLRYINKESVSLLQGR